MIALMRRVAIAIFVISALTGGALAQAPPANSVWNALSAPAMDRARSAHAENLEIVRDRIRITLTDGTIQFTQPVNGVTFGAAFRGKGRVQVDPPNPIEAQQLKFFTKEEKINFSFTDATFSFTDGLADEVAKQVKWLPSAAANDDLYASRQKAREDLGEAAMPRMLQGILAADRPRTAYFLADLKLAGKDWVEFRYDALDPEDIRVTR
jgi:hypothetical protein